MLNRLPWRFLGALAAIAPLLMCGLAQAATYYVDPINGRDYYTGTASSVNRNVNVGPWQTVTPVQNANLQPGDIVRFKRGGVFPNGLVINKSGNNATNGAITFTSYGSGNLPVFKRGTNNNDWANAIEVSGQYIVLDGLSAQDVHYCGISLTNTAHHVTVRYCYITNTGLGIFLNSSSNNTITNNTVVSLHMVTNTERSINNNDDFGATAIWLNDSCSYNRITNNILSKCRAPSFDYGYDGGALEIYMGTADSVSDNNLFSGNRVDEGVGVIEIGADSRLQQTGKVSNLTLSNNVCYKNGTFSAFHYDKLVYQNVVVANNTIVEPYDFIATSLGWRYSVMGYDAGFTDYTTTIWYNNIVYVGSSFQKLADGFFATHYNNDYFLESTSSTQYGLIPNTNGNITANPLFVTYDPTKNFEYQNFRLQSGSPAGGKGAYVPGGYNLN